MYRRKGVKHGEDSVIVWECMAARGTSSLVVIDDVTADRISQMNSEICRTILCHIQPNALKLRG